MKRFISISLVILAGVVLLASCRKRDYHDDIDRREDAYVYEYADEFFTVEFIEDGRFAVLESLDNESFWPDVDERLRGDFGSGRKRIQNITAGFEMNVNVIETNIRTEADAQEAIDYYYYERYGVYPEFAMKNQSLKLQSGRQKIGISR
ncbi:hypothetical protein [Niabella ginsengisoli]|uniref:Uncharacterized protein n=1 Tax=Niabella ginsengisoli TaxID=522298 RepID=A0ABS9SL34_9BACT|nr:hypothetical protein [Niabella ginsengisoli]MCH5599099.1 hypothetical protein [Niabella ginsengisoli]